MAAISKGRERDGGGGKRRCGGGKGDASLEVIVQD